MIILQCFARYKISWRNTIDMRCQWSPASCFQSYIQAQQKLFAL